MLLSPNYAMVNSANVTMTNRSQSDLHLANHRRTAMRPTYSHRKGLHHTKLHVEKAIESALKVRENWSNMTWETRAHIFLKAADLLATKYRFEMNASTMLGQSKNAYQAEIDAACELIDF